MSNNCGKVRTLRLFVEPLDVELDADDGLLFSALQMAFPGASSVYYKGGECKTAVKFDGKHFRPPGGHWNDKEYFVSLGNRTMNYPFGGYENASKQFERSVNAVQQMLGSSLFGGVGGRTHRSENGGVKTGRAVGKASPSPSNGRLPPSRSQSIEEAKQQNVTSIQEREKLLRSAGRQLSPIEQQFVDLARISNGKDTIIQEQRNEIQQQKISFETLNKQLKKAQEECERLQQRMIGQEEELGILRRLSSDQTYMCEKVNDLTKRLSDRESELSKLRYELTDQIGKLKDENADLQRRFAAVSADLSERTSRVSVIEEDLKLKTMDNYEMTLELKRLRTLAKRIDLESLDDLETYADTRDDNKRLKEANARLLSDLAAQRECHSLFEKNAMENARLIERNSDLETRMSGLHKQLESINERWRENLTRIEEEWNVKRSELELEKTELRRQLGDMQRMFESATRDVAETTRRLDEARASRDELRGTLENIESRHQAKLSGVEEQMREAEQRAAEMVSLVASLTADARSSRREVEEII